jgi:hypothetical protein
MKSLLLLFGLFLISLNASADEAYISSLDYSGSGCEQDDATAILSPDQKVLSLLFDNFIVEAGAGQGIRNKKSCAIRINISVPDNKRITIQKIDYRGYAMVPQVARMYFKSSYNIEIPSLGFSTRTFNHTISKLGELDEDLYVEQRVFDRITSKACGRDVVMNINSEMSAVTNRNKDEAYLSLDSIDSGIDYHLEYEECFETNTQVTPVQSRQLLREEARRNSARQGQNAREERRRQSQSPTHVGTNRHQRRGASVNPNEETKESRRRSSERRPNRGNRWL